jgi:septal ring factor EnvC (AmiA/AmiB activator)
VLRAVLCCAVFVLQIRNEQLINIVRKVQGECEFVLKQASTAAEKQEVLAAQLAKLSKSLEQTEERIKKAAQEAKVC